MSNPQRTKKFVDTKVQGALARRLVLHWLIFMVVASTVAFVLQVLSNPFLPLMDHVENIWLTQGPFLLVMVFLLPVFVLDTIKLSHRFAGPIFSLRRAMREVAQGKQPRKLKFRGNDFWHDLATEYNAVIDKLAPTTGKANSPIENKQLVEAQK